MLKYKYKNFIILVSFNLYNKDKKQNLVSKYYDTSLGEKEILSRFNKLRLDKGILGKFDTILAKRFVNAYIKKINTV